MFSRHGWDILLRQKDKGPKSRPPPGTTVGPTTPPDRALGWHPVPFPDSLTLWAHNGLSNWDMGGPKRLCTHVDAAEPCPRSS